jgi:hypothetical protein
MSFPLQLAASAFLTHITPMPQAGTIQFRPITEAWSGLSHQDSTPSSQEPLEAPCLLAQGTYQLFHRSVDLLFGLFTRELAPGFSAFPDLISTRMILPDAPKGWVVERNQKTPGTLDCFADVGTHIQWINLESHPDLYGFCFYEGAKAMFLNLAPEGVSRTEYSFALQGRWEIEIARRALNRPNSSLLELGLTVADRMMMERQYSPDELGGGLFLGLARPKRLIPLHWKENRWNGAAGEEPEGFFIHSQNRTTAPFRIKGHNPSNLVVNLPPPEPSVERAMPLIPSLCRLWNDLPATKTTEEPEEDATPLPSHPAMAFLSHLNPLPEEGTVEFRPFLLDWPDLIDWLDLTGLSHEECLGEPRRLTEESSEDFFRSLDHFVRAAQKGLKTNAFNVYLEEECVVIPVQNDAFMEIFPNCLVLNQKTDSSSVSFAQRPHGRIEAKYEWLLGEEANLLNKILGLQDASPLETALELVNQTFRRNNPPSVEQAPQILMEDEDDSGQSFLLVSDALAVDVYSNEFDITFHASPGEPLPPPLRRLWEEISASKVSKDKI